MKVIDKSQMRRDMDKIRSEITILMRCRHPSIVAASEVFESNAHVCLVMERYGRN